MGVYANEKSRNKTTQVKFDKSAVDVNKLCATEMNDEINHIGSILPHIRYIISLVI